MIKTASLFFAGLLLLVGTACRAQNFWKPASGTPFGAIQAFALDNEGKILAATTTALFCSSDNGLSWLTINSNMPTPDLSLLAADSNGNLYSNGDSFMRSTDNGVTWMSLKGKFGDTNYYLGISSIACMGNGVVFAGTDVGSFGNGLYKSTDYGDSWNLVDTLFHRSIAIDRKGNVFVTTPTGILKSTDTGKTWLPANNGVKDQYTFILVATNDCMFAADYNTGTIYKSTDQGNSWNTLFGVSSISSLSARDSSVLVSYGSRVIYYNGANNHITIQKVYVGATDGGLYATLMCPNGKMLVSDIGDGYYASDDSGSTWLQGQTGLWAAEMPLTIASNGDVYTGGNGVYRSTDEGNTWERVDSEFSPNGLDPDYPYSDEDPNVGTIALSQGGDMYVNEGRTFRSSDTGHTWVEIDSGLYNSYGYLANILWSLTINRQNNYIFGGTEQSGVWRSTNEGDTWERTSTGMTDQQIVTTAIDRNGIVYALTEPGVGDGSIYRSLNNGQTWMNVCPDLSHTISSGDSSFLTAITIAPNGTIFVGTSNVGLFRSTDSGNSWISLVPNLDYQYILALASDSEGNIFASNLESHNLANIHGSLISVSTDKGNSWSDISTGLPSLITSLAVERNGAVYGATYDGVYRFDSLDIAALTVKSLSAESSTISLSQNSPNPFTASTSISFTLAEPAFVTLTLIDCAGREIEMLASEYMNSGSHSVEFERGNLPAGVYFYRLTANGSSQTAAMVIE